MLSLPDIFANHIRIHVSLLVEIHSDVTTELFVDKPNKTSKQTSLWPIRHYSMRSKYLCIFFVGMAVAHVGAIPESAASQNQVNWPSGFRGDPGIAPLQKRINGNCTFTLCVDYNQNDWGADNQLTDGPRWIGYDTPPNL